MAASFHPRPLPFYYFGHNCTVSSLASCKLSEVYNVVSFTLNQANRLDYSESGAGGRYRTGNQRRDTEQILFCVDKLNTPVGRGVESSNENMIPACTHWIAIIILSLSCSTTGAFLLANKREPRVLYSRLDAEPVVIAGVVVATAGAMAWWISGADDRAKRVSYAEREARGRAYQEERERLAYIEPRGGWREEELQAYDGSRDEIGPILMAVKGDVFNVWKGRNFYGKGGEYHIMAGMFSLPIGIII